MNETLLLFHAPSRPELLKIQRALLPLHIRLRCISQKDYLQPLGFRPRPGKVGNPADRRGIPEDRLRHIPPLGSNGRVY